MKCANEKKHVYPDVFQLMHCSVHETIDTKNTYLYDGIEIIHQHIRCDVFYKLYSTLQMNRLTRGVPLKKANNITEVYQLRFSKLLSALTLWMMGVRT